MNIKIIKGIETPIAKFFCSSPETDAFFLKRGMWNDEILAFCRKLERERDEAITRRMETIMQCELYEQERNEAREVFREMWQSGDAFLPYIDQETITRWRKAVGWEETK